MDIGERPPVEGVEDEASDKSQKKLPTASASVWSPNEEFIQALLEMGVSRNAAEKV